MLCLLTERQSYRLYVDVPLSRLQAEPDFFINLFFSHIQNFFPTLSLKTRRGNCLLVPQRSYGPDRRKQFKHKLLNINVLLYQWRAWSILVWDINSASSEYFVITHQLQKRYKKDSSKENWCILCQLYCIHANVTPRFAINLSVKLRSVVLWTVIFSATQTFQQFIISLWLDARL